MRTRPLASISLDLDNVWAYMRAHGVSGWRSFPTYLPQVVPRILETAERLDLRLTVFVVGRDAELEENRESLQSLVAAGHQIGNHSYLHEPWMHAYSAKEIREDLDRAEAAIGEALEVEPTVFRGPGFSISNDLLKDLCRRGYRCDASTFPTFIGPLLRAAYFRSADLTKAERDQRSAQFGTLGDGRRPMKPYRFQVGNRSIIEVPVTTMPVFRFPIHLTYIHYLAGVSSRLARLYFRSALLACKAFGVAPSVLLHPLDFLAADALPDLARFPGLGPDSARKRDLTEIVLRDLQATFRLLSLEEYVDQIEVAPDSLKTVAIS
jgi:hypothetical protein